MGQPGRRGPGPAPGHRVDGRALTHRMPFVVVGVIVRKRRGPAAVSAVTTTPAPASARPLPSEPGRALLPDFRGGQLLLSGGPGTNRPHGVNPCQGETMIKHGIGLISGVALA